MFYCLEGECDDKSHSFLSLKEVDKMIRREFSTSLKKVSESITKLCKVEKGSMLALDEVEEKCQSLSRMVETMAKKLVRPPKCIRQNNISYTRHRHKIRYVSASSESLW